jgi:hypothetical protein
MLGIIITPFVSDNAARKVVQGFVSHTVKFDLAGRRRFHAENEKERRSDQVGSTLE